MFAEEHVGKMDKYSCQQWIFEQFIWSDNKMHVWRKTGKQQETRMCQDDS